MEISDEIDTAEAESGLPPMLDSLDHHSPAASGPGLDVCLASPFFYPEYSGGAERFRRYAPGLGVRGVRMHVMAAPVGTWKPWRRFTPKDAAKLGSPSEDPAVPVQRVPLPPPGVLGNRVPLPPRIAMWRNKWAFESAILARCRNPTTRPDLLIWRYPLAVASVRALSALRRMRVPMIRVVTIFESAAGSGLKRVLNRSAYPVPFRYLDCVIVSAEAMRKNLHDLGVRTRIEVVPHGVDLRRFHPPASPSDSVGMRKRIGLAPEDEMILFVGPIDKRKGVDTLATAWDRIAGEHPRAHLVLVGHEQKSDGNTISFSQQVRRILARGRGAERVIWVGPVQDVEAYMRCADIFVLPSHREGMPNVVLEAFASGLPCVLTPFLGFPEELGRDGDQYVLVDHHPEQVAQAIMLLLADESRRRRLGDSALRWVREHLDVERSLDSLTAICEDVVRRSPG